MAVINDFYIKGKITGDDLVAKNVVSASSLATDKDGKIVAGSGGVTDHGALTGLSDDDHTQYHNDTRGDSRYLKLNQSSAQTITASPIFNWGLSTCIPYFDSNKMMAVSAFLKWDNSICAILGGWGNPQSSVQFGSDSISLMTAGASRFVVSSMANYSYSPMMCWDSWDYPALSLDCYGNMKPFISFSGWESYTTDYNISLYGCYTNSWATGVSAPDANYWTHTRMIKVVVSGSEHWIPAYQVVGGGGSGSGS